MKKKHVYIAFLTVMLCVSLVMALNPELTLSAGRCVRSKAGECFLVLDNTPVALSSRSGNPDFFNGLNTGDPVFVIHNGIQETFPAQTQAYLCLRLGSGGASDIPQDVMDGLAAVME
ncbi:MAG: hypothetical protein ACI4PH_08370 [Faecousia sp.]